MSSQDFILFALQITLMLTFAVVFGQAMRKLGQPAVLGEMIGGIVLVAAIVGAGWTVEWLVETDREAIETSLDQTATALEHNDVNEVLSHIAPEAAEVRERLAALLPSITIEQAKVRDLDVQVQTNTDPKTARAQLRGIIHGRDKGGQMPYDTFMRRFSVRLRQDKDKWLITDYEELPMELPGGQKLP